MRGCVALGTFQWVFQPGRAHSKIQGGWSITQLVTLYEEGVLLANRPCQFNAVAMIVQLSWASCVFSPSQSTMILPRIM
jgi:hypothetical protein